MGNGLGIVTDLRKDFRTRVQCSVSQARSLSKQAANRFKYFALQASQKQGLTQIMRTLILSLVEGLKKNEMMYQ